MAPLTSHALRTICQNRIILGQLNPKIVQNSSISSISYCQSRRIAISSVSYDSSKDIKTPSKLKTVAVKKYVGLLGKFEQTLENKYPKAHKIFLFFRQGVKDFFADTKMHYKVTTDLWKGRSPKTFTWRELENYRTHLYDIMKSAPALVIFAAPGGYALLPIVYFFPRQLLCKHFWTEEQREKFGLYYFNHRIKHYPNIMHYMEQHSKDIKKEDLKLKFNNLLQQIQGGKNGTIEDLLAIERLFVNRPFALGFLSKVHRIHYWHIAKSWSFSTWRKSKLIQDIQLIHYIDLALDKENLNELTNDDLKTLCFSRGLCPVEVDRDTLVNYLEEWIKLSKNINGILIHIIICLRKL
ncbi:DgyrCDS4651 [Dimorphilus gyrociliatus]|uniref:DgyrCDS4651 n=1 Tax=Dimorphilus gyrociliatus TaxID=2664684 RepID=A0A7I8VI48_9ANNE|nr:DgyrCDS4651 [Dimorphilus gyrociliatus]